MSDQVAVNYLKTFLDRHPTRSFKKGEIIIFQGEAPRSAFVVRKGTVKAYNLSVNGDEKPVAFYSANNAFPASWIYGKVPSAIYYYEAFTPEVEVHVIDRDEFVEFIRKRPELLYQELERLLADQMGGSIRLNALQHSRASDKLVYTLHYLALTHGRPLEDSKIELTLDLTHQDFANLTGLTRETAATELNKLKKQGVIEYGKNLPYRLNLNNLMQLLNDQFIADIQRTSLAF
ncbi:MAG TPA: Crp/Fnr family transcriptional regulator [Candidatus Saccharimonadales bacterium]|jgi:CRP/FNR family transcriptional regulator|nr:Crp/Fnr family transcriptional regulator [Candidatus Saccharimonadales bacterium]